MAGSGSSSKRKSSKNKSVKISYEKKKKSQRKQSNKRPRDYDSISSYSDDESLNSGRVLSSTSKPDRKRRTNKPKKHHDRSVSSYSNDQSISSDSDSLSTYDNSHKSKKKPKWSQLITSKKKRKYRVVKTRKKSSKKAKSKKYLSSSSSSESESYQSSSSSEDRKRKRSKVKLDNEIERPRGRESYKSYKKRKMRSISCSSRGTGGDHSVSVDHSNHSDGALAPVNNSRRLRSVITFVDRCHDEGENKEEIVYDYDDDYPSPKSMDSNEGGNKMEIDDNSRGAIDEKIRVENVVAEEITELGNSGVDENNVDINKFEREKEASRVDDLELILRQKALENLRKFRGGIQTGSTSTDNKKMTNESDVKDPSPGNVDIIQNKLANRSISTAREMDQSSGPTLERDSSRVDIIKQPNSEQEPGMAKRVSDHEPDGVTLLGLSEGANYVIGSDASSGSGAIGQSLEEQQNKANDGSEFKQKTMSVMRGGEMVQVSYKVYIPKKAPALARRQLRR